MAMEFDRESVVNSFRWIGHWNAWTEVNIFHPMYRPGKHNLEHNLKYRAFPSVVYVRDELDLLNLIGKFHGERMICFGINPRQSVKTYPSGHARAHRDLEIEVVKNFYFDFDLTKGSDKEQLASLELFLEKIAGRIEDNGFNRPVKAFTGNGFHLLFALPEIRVEECRDIKERIKAFRQSVLEGLESELESLCAKIDPTDDLSRKVKVYGTAKPGRKVLSRFYGYGKRIEDSRLRDHVLAMNPNLSEFGGRLDLDGMKLPNEFRRMLQQDERLRNLWLGKGKLTGDLTRSGYDYSLVGACMARGITDIRDLAAILALRPGGSIEDKGKGETYVRATIAKAVRDFQWGSTRERGEI